MPGYFLLALPLLLASQAICVPLGLNEYLKQVSSNHQGVRSAHESAEAAFSRSDEGSLLTSPNLFAEIGYLNDAKETMNPSFQGTRTLALQSQLGVAQQTSFGLSAKLYYLLSHTQLEGTGPAFVPVPDYFEARPTLEVSQSLWRNGFGSETRALKEASYEQAMAKHYGETFKEKMLLAQANTIYWRLVVTREMVEVQSAIHRSSEKLRQWNAARTRSGLADKSDLLQAEAGLQGRTIELEAAQNERDAAERQFNSFRGKTDPRVTDELEKLVPETLLKMEIPKREEKREDVKAAESVFKASIAAANLGKEKNSPDLHLIGSASLNGRDAERGTTVSDSFKTANPTFALGLKFSMPLAVGTILDNRKAYVQEQQAAELIYRRTAFEADREWTEQTARFEEAKKRLARLIDLQKTQNDKLANEREKLKRGRSVTYQVLLFEQDYANAEALRLKTELEILSLQSILLTYTKKESAL